MFMHILFTFWWHHHPLGGDQMSQFCGSKFFWILDYNTSLKEPLIDFSVSDSKIMTKLSEINLEIPWKFLSKFLKYFKFLNFSANS